MCTKQLKSDLNALAQQLDDLRREWQMFTDTQRTALESDDPQAWARVEYRRQRVPIEALQIIEQRARLRLALVEEQLRTAQAKQEQLYAVVQAKREELYRLLDDLHHAERAYAEYADGDTFLTTTMAARLHAGRAVESLQQKRSQLLDAITVCETLRPRLLQGDTEAVQLVSALLEDRQPQARELKLHLLRSV